MKKTKIKLATGKIVTLEAFHLSKTYGGIIEGNPSTETNNALIKYISYPRNWGERKSVYNRAGWYLSDKLLKPITYSAWLTAESIDDQEGLFNGSEIIVIWMGNEPNNKTIEELIVSGLGLFKWDKFAENFLI